MMVFLAAAVTLVGLLCVLDLLLTVGVIRRLREHTSLLSLIPVGMLPAEGIVVGETVTEFTATTIDGEPLARDLLAGRTLVGFFSRSCQPCSDELPRFVEYARSMPGGREQVLAVAVDDAGAYAEELAAVARVVIEASEGPVQAAFRVSGLPALYLLDAGGVVAASGHSMSSLDSAPAGQASAVTA